MEKTVFDKSLKVFPNKSKAIFLAHCSISPTYNRGVEMMQQFTTDIGAEGVASLPRYFELLPTLHKNGARLLGTSAENISYVHNTAEAMSMIANGYPFSPGDQIISYMHEYPSNHYPWYMQKKRGVELILLSDSSPSDHYADINKPKGWSMEELESKVSAKTRLVAISHVQFSSGYAADLKELGAFCLERNIDLVVDCAQSLGCLPVYPEEFHISAVASSAWKWLMGPWGSGLLYTSADFRKKLDITMVGPGTMRQGINYLDVQWNPREDGRMFEYSTLPWDHIGGLNVILEEIFLRYTPEAIRDEIFRLQNLLLEHLDTRYLRLLQTEEKHRSGILAAEPVGDYNKIVGLLMQEDVVISAPIGYLRFAPHFYNDDDQIVHAAQKINKACALLS